MAGLPGYVPRWFDSFTFTNLSAALANVECISNGTDDQRSKILAPYIKSLLSSTAGIIITNDVAERAAVNLVRTWQGFVPERLNLGLIPISPPPQQPPDKTEH